MRAVPVNQQTIGIVFVICVAADMRTPVDNQDRSAGIVCQTLCEHGSGKTGSDDEIIEFHRAIASECSARSSSSSIPSTVRSQEEAATMLATCACHAGETPSRNMRSPARVNSCGV